MFKQVLTLTQEGTVRAVGARTETAVDVRIIAATNRNLIQEMGAGRFRKDLFYRIAVLTIETPPLRKRPTDVPILIHHFMREAEEKIKSPHKHEIESDALVALCNYGWPGNVRELRHVIERLVATTIKGKITAEAVETAMASAT